MMTTVKFPEKLGFLFRPARYKIAYGGRGSAKSWSYARALLLKAAEKPLRILCCREIQKSIKDSVHKVLSDQIHELGLDASFDVQQAVIKGRNGSEFFFEGLRHNATNIKSYEGVDICWVEEAHLVSKSSWEILIPTIRKDDSEIWVSFNPELEEDETYQRFVINPPDGAVVVKLNWSDNPWFPDVLMQEMKALRKRDHDAYLTIWEGHCRQILEGAVWANEIRTAREENRICRVPYNPSHPVDTYWDLGWADNTSIWFVQPAGFEFHVIDFYQDSLKGIQHYTKELQSRKYNIRMCYLPHDSEQSQLAASGRTVAQQVRAAGYKVSVMPRISQKILGINAARAVFPMCWFDENKCADGLHALRHYRYEQDPDTGRFSRDPLHDWASHAADAFMALGANIKNPKMTVHPKTQFGQHQSAWGL